MTIAELIAELRLQPDTKSFDMADKVIGKVQSALVALVAVSTAFKFAGLIQETVDLGSHINDLSQSLGVPVDTLQELGYAAKLNGSSMEGMGTALKKLAVNMNTAAAGGKEQSKAFTKMGVSIKDANGKIRPAEDVLGDIADHLATMPDGAEKTALAMSVMGRSGNELIPMLNGGSKEMAKMRQEARDLGGVITKEQITALDDLGDSQDKVKFAMAGLRNEAVVQLVPMLQEMANSFLAWVKANRKIIAQKIATVIKGIALAVQGLAYVVKIAVDVMEFFAQHTGLLISILGGLTAAMILFKIEAVRSAIVAAAGWVLAALPFILLAALIAGAILIIQDLYTWFTGGDSAIKDLYNSFKSWLGDALVATWNGSIDRIKAAFQAFIGWVQDKIDWLWDKITAVKDYLLGNEEKGRKFLATEGGAEFLAQYGLSNVSDTEASSPSIAMPSNTPSSSSFAPQVNVTVHAQTGATAQDIASESMKAARAFLDDMVRNLDKTTP